MDSRVSKGIRGTREHPSHSAYVGGCRCDGCRAAHTQYCIGRRVARTKRLEAGEAAPPHGDVGTYVNWGCRCRPCTVAHTARMRRYHERRRRGEVGNNDWVIT